MNKIEETIDEYSEKLLAEPEIKLLPEEQKAELYAKVHDRLHKTIANALERNFDRGIVKKISDQLDREAYDAIETLVKKHEELNSKILFYLEEEFMKLKSLIKQQYAYGGAQTRQQA